MPQRRDGQWNYFIWDDTGPFKLTALRRHEAEMTVLEHTAAFNFLALSIEHATATLEADDLGPPVLLKAAGKHFPSASGCLVDEDHNRRPVCAGLFFAPAKTTVEYTPPSYVKPNAFREKEVTVGTGEWVLPATLTLPMGQGLFPAVVFVHGSGPLDRDETVGQNKPFRDLAGGLASQGIAVLRYEKRTKQYAAKLGSTGGQFTVKEETIDDVLAAVALLRKTKGIDARRIFVLGRGMLVPRISKLDPNIIGLIVLAGATKPTEEAILEQTTYVFSLDGTISKEEQAQLEVIKQQVAKVKSLKPSDGNSALLLFGAPASYWLDLRGYYPPEAAKALKQRLLILQGERDYQVTMEDFQRWKAALSSKQNVTFKSYPKLNHLFIEGSGKSVPSEYNMSGHVAEVVIDYIANWIKK